MNINKIHRDKYKWLHIFLLLGWLVIGICLRLLNIEEKSASSIEIATLGFSLGHSFSDIPLDRVISLDTLLSPLRFEAAIAPSEITKNLLNESTHPPLYFLLTGFWLSMFSEPAQLVTLSSGRSLSAIFGAVSIPAIFGLGWLAFKSRIVGQIAAALMAVSPYGIYLAQEARHYTLTILWIIASFACLIVAIRHIERQTSLPVSISSIWILVNSLGFATHYFFSLTLCVQGILIGLFWLRDIRIGKSIFNRCWRRIYAVAAGTSIACLVWLPVVAGISENELTDWIQTSYDLEDIWQPFLRLLAWWITMVFLLPVEGTNLTVTILSASIILLVLVWVSPEAIRGLRHSMMSSRLSVLVFGGFLAVAIALFLVIIYVYGRDLSKAARYHFVYFPAVILLLGAAFGVCWESKPLRQKVVVVLLMGLLGALSVVFNYGFQKSRRSDLLVGYIETRSAVPVAIATTYETFSELRELIGLGYDFRRLKSTVEPKFLLLDRKNYTSEDTSPVLREVLTEYPRPLDLWAVNLKADSDDLEAINCMKDSRKFRSGYKTRLYHCR